MAPSLNSIDLFSGIGGFTIALAGWAEPIVYCDNDPTVISTLQSLIQRKKLTAAPILTDVRDLAQIVQTVNSSKIDLITSGFPCTGFSSSGSKAGLANDHSALFFDTAKVVAAIRPGMVMFENVMAILSHPEDMETICSTMRGLGYDLTWTVVSAADVGAPQRRARWFCLCVRRGYVMPDLTSRHAVQPFKWTSGRPKITCPRKSADVRAMAMLGNAIVPDCARLAFARLYSGFAVHESHKIPRTLRHAKPCLASQCPDKQEKWPEHATVSRSGKVRQVAVSPLPQPVTKITVDPDHFKPTVQHKQPWRLSHTPSHGSTAIRTFWPTPRANSPTHTSVMTTRTKNDLPTAAMFASHIDGRRQPSPGDGDVINAAFVEWLMGYSAGHSRGK